MIFYVQKKIITCYLPWIYDKQTIKWEIFTEWRTRIQSIDVVELSVGDDNYDLLWSFVKR
jgi:hypothetical protein